MMPSGIPAATACDCAAAELLVELPLQPAVEVHGRRMLGDELGDAVGAGMLQRFGPLMPVAAVLLGQRTPGGEVVEGRTFPRAESGIRQFSTRRARDPIDLFQGRPLGCPGRVAVDGIERVGVALHVVA